MEVTPTSWPTWNSGETTSTRLPCSSSSSAGESGDGGMRAGGDHDGVGMLSQDEGRCGLDAQPDIHAQLANLGGEKPHDADVFRARRRTGGQQYLAAELGGLLQ